MNVEGEQNIFHDMNRLKEFMSIKPALKKILKIIQRTEDMNEYTQVVTERKERRV